ncbi:visual pigment-like receptor peropsin, partial [Patella vulgata]|uniref:visual pigment-like receptor peropsin n=1 Tax=Patella vulgata TaxID=6465 RepID=UPI0024A9E8BB
GVIATVGNLMVLTMFCREQQFRRKPHDLLLLNLAIADIGISVCCKKLEVEKHVTWICLLMTGTFTILWSPYTFVCLWSVYDANLPIWITTWPTMFAKASCMINPIIYYLSNPLFRKCARRLLSCQFHQRDIVR